MSHVSSERPLSKALCWPAGNAMVIRIVRVPGVSVRSRAVDIVCVRAHGRWSEHRPPGQVSASRALHVGIADARIPHEETTQHGALLTRKHRHVHVHTAYT